MLSLVGILLVSVGLLGYIYILYPLLLAALVRLRGPRVVRTGAALPPVTLIISAFNEEAAIAPKLENSLALDYPAHLLTIVVVSDASDDGTDAVVLSFADRGVRLFRQDARRGKTAGLNAVVPTLTSDILVFSDANAMYDRAALRMLVRNFADPEVGSVTGEARYLTDHVDAASAAERIYWHYELRLKRLESAVGSLVGGDGAIYAIRRPLWQELPDDAINDFMNPLQIVAAGWRGVYEPEAFCYEETAGNARREYRRRVRIVSRSWRAVFLAGPVLNPFRVGIFAVCLLSHKVLRWMTGFFIACAFVSTLLIGWHAAAASRYALALVGGTVGLLAFLSPRVRRAVSYAGYYLIVSTASVVGLIKGSFGRVSGIWATTRAEEPGAPTGLVLPWTGRLLLALAGAGVIAAVIVLIVSRSVAAKEAVFWGAAGVLAYIYFGYPLVLAAVRPLLHQPVMTGHIEPTVCLFIAANDEAGVMEDKLRNSVSVDYPASRLTVVVASDGSVDGTNDIVRAFPAPNVRLLDFPERRGKISAINDGLRQVDSDIVVLSDANTFLRPDAIRALVRNFADPAVGAVSGDVALVGDRASLAQSEDLYYRYERWLQHAESDVGSMLGVDGALYAIRRSLFVPPPPDTILDDMAIPMGVVRLGRRVVFEPAALAQEYGSESASEEFSRKVRVVAGAVQFLLRSDSAVPARNVQLLLALLSHKTLRWMTPMFATLAFAASLTLASGSRFFFWIAVLQTVSIAAALLGCIPAVRKVPVLGLAHYFWLVQSAALIGFARGLMGRQAVAWRRFARATQPAV